MNDHILTLARENAPCYLYEYDVLRQQTETLRRTFPQYDLLYSIKANPFPPVVRALAALGIGADAASAREVLLSRECGMAAGDIFFSAAGKTEQALETAWNDSEIIADSLGEVARIGALCKQHHVTVLSDEIHCDLTAPGVEYVPFAAVDETCRAVSITCIAPTKTFNLAGLHTSAVYAADPVLHHKAWRALNTDEVAEPNCFAAPAAVAAFTEGGEWLDAARAYIWENKRLVQNFAQRELPGVKVRVSEATYLLWVDVSALTDNVRDFTDRLRAETGLWVTAGTVYGESGEGFFRWNLACPRSTVEDGLNRLKQFLKK